MGNVSKKSVESYGFGHVWVMQAVGDINYFIKILKTGLKGNLIPEWTFDVSKSSKAYHYKNYKLRA